MSTRPPKDEEDHVLEELLQFVDRDITGHPERLKELNSEIVTRTKSLIGNIEVVLDTPLSDDDE